MPCGSIPTSASAGDDVRSAARRRRACRAGLRAPRSARASPRSRAPPRRAVPARRRRSPRSSRSVAPSPRTASVTRKPAARAARAQRGMNCKNSRSASPAPPRWQARGRADSAPGLVVRPLRARPCRRWRAPPRRPGSERRAVASADDELAAPLVGHERGGRQRLEYADALVGGGQRGQPRVMRRPVAASPAWTIRRRECPSSRPSASWPERSASNCTSSSWRSWTRAADLAQHAHRASRRRRGRRRSCRPWAALESSGASAAAIPPAGPVARRLGERRA